MQNISLSMIALRLFVDHHNHNPMTVLTESCGVMTHLAPALQGPRTGGNSRMMESSIHCLLIAFIYCLCSRVLNYLFEQIIVAEDKLKEEVESEKNL